MSMVPVHSVSDFRFHTLKTSAYFLENKTTAFMVQRAQVKVYVVKLRARLTVVHFTQTSSLLRGHNTMK